MKINGKTIGGCSQKNTTNQKTLDYKVLTGITIFDEYDNNLGIYIPETKTVVLKKLPRKKTNVYVNHIAFQPMVCLGVLRPDGVIEEI